MRDIRGRLARIDNRKMTISDGDLFICFPNQIHCYESSLHGQYFLFTISPDFCIGIKDLLSDNVPENNILKLSKDDDIIKTGCVVQFVRNKSVVDSVAIVVKGDATGDGVINGKDIIRIKKQILEGGAVEYPEYADINCDGTVDENDLSTLTAMM